MRFTAWARPIEPGTAGYAAMRAIDVYYAGVDVAGVLSYVDKRARPFLEQTAHAAQHHDALHELPKLTEVDEAGRRRIVDHPPVITHRDEATVERIDAVLTDYRESLQEDRRVLFDRYHLVDAALKVVGVGSVGLAAFAVLFMNGDDDPLFLQFKQAEPSVLERYLGPSPATSPGLASSPASAGSRQRATSCWVGQRGRSADTGTSVSSRTRRAARSSMR